MATVDMEYAPSSSGGARQSAGLMRWIELVILWGTPLMILIDTINGGLLRGGGVEGVSQVIKVAYLGLLAVCAVRSRSGLLMLTVCVISNVLFLGVHSLAAEGVSAITLDLQWLLRFNIMWLGYHFFRRSVERGTVSLRYCFRVFCFVSLVLALNLVLGTLGYGYSQYGKYDDADQIGAVGFIFAGNEMSYLMLLCQVMVCGWIYHSRGGMLKYLVVCALFVLASILKATKVAMLGSLLVAVAFPAMEVIKGVVTLRLRSWRGVILFAGMIISIVLALPGIVYLIEKTGLMRRIEYFMDEYGLLFTIFSGREQFLADFMDRVWPRYSWWEVLVGVGRQRMLSMLGRPVEIDLFDLLGAFGIAGALIYYGFFLKRLGVGLLGMREQRADLATIQVVSIVLLLAISMTAGHVIYSGLAAPYIALAVGTCSAKLIAR